MAAKKKYVSMAAFKKQEGMESPAQKKMENSMSKKPAPKKAAKKK